MRIAAYVYPGWHPIEERDRAFYRGFTEWDLVYSCAPRFPGHGQPRIPAWGRYDDRDPAEVGRRVRLAAAHGVDAFVYGFFWCRGKRVFQEALDEGFLGSAEGRAFPFALMWANRMPRRVLPVRRRDLPVVDGERRASSDVRDFADLVAYVAERYFRLPNYVRLEGRPYFSIFDSTFFLRELGFEGATRAIAAARARLRAGGFPGMHLAAVEPARGFAERVREVGFDSVTNYVLLPYWKGEFLQDYSQVAERRAGEWAGIARAAGLPYHPSVSPGWDASPRGADFGREKPRKYPWWPVVTGEHPERFREALARAVRFARSSGAREATVFIASFNEWSEGHYLEPDARHGTAWLEAVKAAREEQGLQGPIFRFPGLQSERSPGDGRLVREVPVDEKTLLAKVWESWTTGKRPEIPAAVEEGGNPEAVLTNYLSLQRDLYWEKTCLEASLAASRWGIAYARRNRQQEAETVLLYNLATYTLPWWSDSLEATAGQREEGLAAARETLSLRRALKRGPADLSKAFWALGAHHLLRGDPAPAIEHFNAGVAAAREAQDKGLEACALDGLARTRVFLVPADRAWGLETLREAAALYEEAKDTLNLQELRRLEARLTPAKGR